MRRGDADANTNAYLHANSDAYSDIYAYAYGNIYADSYGNVYADALQQHLRLRYSNVYADGNGYATPTPHSPTPTPTLTPCALAACSPPYPFVSGNPRTNIAFNESEVLRAFRMTVDANCNPQTLQMFYNDEHAMTLGIRQVQVITGNCGASTSTTNYPISPMVTATRMSAITPSGWGDHSGRRSGRGIDTAGRPMYPSDVHNRRDGKSGEPACGRLAVWRHRDPA